MGCFALLWIFLIASTASAEVAKAQIIVEAVTDDPFSSASDSPVGHFFGGQSVSLPLNIYGAPKEMIELKARLFQLTSRIAAPVGKDLEIFSNTDLSDNIRKAFKLPITLPSVKRESDFELRFLVRLGPDGHWKPAGSAKVRIYPRDLLKPIRAWAEKHDLRVRDSTGSLGNFLSARQIRFTKEPGQGTLNPTLPAATPGTLLIVPNRDRVDGIRKWDRPGLSVVVFNEGSGTIPKVVLKRGRHGVLLIIDMELLDALQADPRAQKIFLEIFKLVQRNQNEE